MNCFQVRKPLEAFAQIDKGGQVRLNAVVNYTAAKSHYLAALGKDPKMTAPKLRMGTVSDFHEWKQEMRAYDAAQIELKLVTPRQVQERNAAVNIRQGRGRIVRHAVHA